MLIKATVALIMCVFFYSVAYATEEMGQAILNGKSITVFADGTWKFSEEALNSTALQNCRKIESKKIPVTVCLSPDDWQNYAASGSYEFMVQHKFDEVYAGLIPEKTYIPATSLRTAIINNAASAMSLGQPDIIDEGTVKFSEQTWSYIDFKARIDEIEFFFKIFYYSSESVGSVQFVFFSSKDNAVLVQQYAKDISLKIN